MYYLVLLVHENVGDRTLEQADRKQQGGETEVGHSANRHGRVHPGLFYDTIHTKKNSKFCFPQSKAKKVTLKSRTRFLSAQVDQFQVLQFTSCRRTR